MSTEERIKLALTSQEMAIKVSATRLKIPWIGIEIKDEKSNVDMDEVVLFCGLKQYQKNDARIMKREQLWPWLKFYDRNPVQSAMKIFQKVLKIMRPKSRTGSLIIDMDNIKTTSIEEILSYSEWRNVDDVSVYGSKITKEELDLIMETAEDDRDIYLNIRDIPRDYSHPNAFKFYDIIYCNARWVQIEYLFTLRNRYDVTLGDNNFTCSDFNKFIEYWIQCDQDMAQLMAFKLNSDQELDEAVLLNRLITLKTIRSGVCFYLFIPNVPEKRKQDVMCLFFGRRELRISCISKDKQFSVYDRSNTESTFSKEFEILLLLNQKNTPEVKDQLTMRGVYYEDGYPTFNYSENLWNEKKT